MSDIIQVREVRDYNSFVGHTGQHPLVSVIDYAEVSPILYSKCEFSLYALFLLDDCLEKLSYGKSVYDYKESTLVCVSPGQVGGSDYTGERFERRGWALLFHPALLNGHALKHHIKSYSFFQYQANEALHLSPGERETFISLLKQIRRTLMQTETPFRETIVVSYVELLLNFCLRFYDRQFSMRKTFNHELLKRFRNLLEEYFNSKELAMNGIPSVSYCADKLFLSPNYFGDLITKLLGETPTMAIRNYALKMIKNKLMDGIEADQIAYDMGFERTQDLKRYFKRHTGNTLNRYLRTACVD